MTIEVLDPTYEHDGAPFALAPRLPTLAGTTIYVQAWTVDALTPLGVSASNAIQAAQQP